MTTSYPPQTLVLRCFISLLVLLCLPPGTICDPALRGGLSTTNHSTSITTTEQVENNNTSKSNDKQQTSVQSFINSYQSGSGFNDTSLTGITGVVPPGHPVAQVAHNPVPGGGVGVISSGGAATGTTGIAGGVMSGLTGQSGVGAGGAGIGSSSTGLGTTAGTIGGAPAGSGAGFVGPSGLPAPIAAPGGVGGVGAGAGGAGIRI